MEIRRDVYQAIADPTRREILQVLASGACNLNTLTENFEMSRQAISLHVKILRECEVISVRKQGRDRICEIQPQSLREVHQWADQFRTFWTEKLKALQFVLEHDSDLVGKSAEPKSY